MRRAIAPVLLLTAAYIGISAWDVPEPPAPPAEITIPAIVPSGLVEIQQPKGWTNTDDTFPCSWDPASTCYYEPADTN